jgi:hypothetical protein
MTTVLEELDSHGVPSATVMPSNHPAAPAAQAVIVGRVAVVDPELASIIGDELDMVPSSTPNEHPACPTRSKGNSAAPAAPPAACVAVAHLLRDEPVAYTDIVYSTARYLRATASHAWIATERCDRQLLQSDSPAPRSGLLTSSTGPGMPPGPSAAAARWGLRCGDGYRRLRCWPPLLPPRPPPSQPF